MYRVTTGMFAEIAEMNMIAQQKFLENRSEPYGPDAIDHLVKLSEELKSVSRLNRSVALETRLHSRELVERLNHQRHP
jgi:hypothetical protein